jgi:hypothetical protein
MFYQPVPDYDHDHDHDHDDYDDHDFEPDLISDVLSHAGTSELPTRGMGHLGGMLEVMPKR